MSRWLRFFIAILVGAALGLLYGWIVSPVQYVDTSPDTLRIDYKTDYVLMTAEAFENEKDLDLALRRLALIGNTPPVETVYQAIQFAQKHDYNETDLKRMQALLNELQGLTSQGSPAP